MPGTPSIRTSRSGIDSQTGDAIDMSFDSDYKLPKIVKSFRQTLLAGSSHGLSYPPQTMMMGELLTADDYAGEQETGVVLGNIRNGSIPNGATDSTNVYIDQVSGTGLYAIRTYVFLDPVDNSTPSTPILTKAGQPVIIVGGEDGDPDYKRNMHSFYDTFKVNKTGTLSISKTAQTFSSGDTGTVDYENDLGTKFVVEKTEATYTHNLGYVPMFSPFVNYEIILEVYFGWLDQWNNRSTWSSGISYIINNIVDDGGSNYYKCIKSHTSASTNEPNVGVDWETYWESYTPPTTQIPETVLLNDLEDVKYIFGGVSITNHNIVRFYTTDTDLKLVLYRMTYDAINNDGVASNSEMQALDLSVKYTIFDNPADEIFDLTA